MKLPLEPREEAGVGKTSLIRTIQYSATTVPVHHLICTHVYTVICTHVYTHSSWTCLIARRNGCSAASANATRRVMGAKAVPWHGIYIYAYR